jgi:hypothetical protein
VQVLLLDTLMGVEREISRLNENLTGRGGGFGTKDRTEA